MATSMTIAVDLAKTVFKVAVFNGDHQPHRQAT